MFNMTPDTVVQWTCSGWSAQPSASPDAAKALPPIQTMDARYELLAKMNERLRQQMKQASATEEPARRSAEAA